MGCWPPAPESADAGFALGDSSIPPPVGGATEQGNGSTAWGLEQVVFREHKLALVIKLHDSAV
jgi:hypothetical protein